MHTSLTPTFCLDAPIEDLLHYIKSSIPGSSVNGDKLTLPGGHSISITPLGNLQFTNGFLHFVHKKLKSLNIESTLSYNKKTKLYSFRVVTSSRDNIVTSIDDIFGSYSSSLEEVVTRAICWLLTTKNLEDLNA